MAAAWQAVRRNGGACGVDGETFQHIEERGVDGWLGGLAEELRENTYLEFAKMDRDDRGGAPECIGLLEVRALNYL